MAAVTDHLAASKPSSEAYQRATGSADFIRSKLPSHLQNPRVGIVCGSGLGGIADTVTAETKLEIDYHDIPNFPKTTGEFHGLPSEMHILTITLVQGHAGKLVVGTMGETKVPVVLLVGRAQ